VNLSRQGDAHPRSVTLRTSSEQVWVIKEAWQRLAATSPHKNVFRTFEWCWAWWIHIGSRDSAHSLYVLTVEVLGQITAIAPLMLRTAERNGLSQRRLEFLGGGGWSDYHDILLGEDSQEDLGAIFYFLARESKNWDLIRLEQVQQHSELERTLQDAVRVAGLHCRRFETERCYFLPIECDFREWLKHRSASSRKTFQTKINRLRRLERAGLKISVIENPQDFSDLAMRMAALEEQKTERGFTPVIGRSVRFFEAVFETLGPGRWIYVITAEHEDRLVAYQLGFRCGENLWDYAKAYDSAHSYFSLGTLMISRLLQYGFEGGFRQYDFLRGDEAYKRRWTEMFRNNVTFIISSSRLRSSLLARYHAQRQGAGGSL